jgi:hypothetical protein
MSPYSGSSTRHARQPVQRSPLWQPHSVQCGDVGPLCGVPAARFHARILPRNQRVCHLTDWLIFGLQIRCGPNEGCRSVALSWGVLMLACSRADSE